MDTTSKTHFLQSKSAKITYKLILIFFLTLLLLIPQSMIMSLIGERQNLNENVSNEVSQGWGHDQVVAGPSLVILYIEVIASTKPNTLPTQERRSLLIHPTMLNINGSVDTLSRHRNLYNVLLYKSNLDIYGVFKIPEENLTGVKQEQLLLDQAYLTLIVSDLKGINKQVAVDWNGQDQPFKPGLRNVSLSATADFISNPQDYNNNGQNKVINTGMHTKVLIDKTTTAYNFKINLDLKGSNTIQFAPLGVNNEIKIKSAFPNPNFIGNFLPDHNITKSGFDASWNILEYNKATPEYQVNDLTIAIQNNLFGIKIQPILDNYRTTYRSGRYMILFVILTFLVVFLTEIVNDLHIHIFQYTLIGFALAIFFILLLSISEFIGFSFAYLAASTATIGLIYLYCASLFKNKKSTLILLSLMIGLFGYIFLIIQLENTALLAGSIGLFVILSGTMYASKKVKRFEDPAST